MSTKVTFNVSEEDMEYARSMWDSADFVLGHVNKLLKERGVDIQFEVENHGDDMPEKFWNEDLEDYNGSGVEIIEE